MVCLLAERSDTKSKVKLGRFRSQLQASNVSSHTKELWYNETICLGITIYIKYVICEHKWTKFNCSKFSYVPVTIQLNISHLFTHS